MVYHSELFLETFLCTKICFLNHFLDFVMCYEQHVTEKRTKVTTLFIGFIPYVLTVQMAIPFNKLPWIELSTFKCDECRLEFFSIGTKSIHDDLYHNTIISKLFTCKFCLYATVSSRDYVNHHQENHTSMYEFITCFHQY